MSIPLQCHITEHKSSNTSHNNSVVKERGGKNFSIAFNLGKHELTKVMIRGEERGALGAVVVSVGEGNEGAS